MLTLFGAKIAATLISVIRILASRNITIRFLMPISVKCSVELLAHSNATFLAFLSFVHSNKPVLQFAAH